ncbi:hypothetical protein [Peterkaempfera bronchialis]|uniref:Uncharacterized protein n=1 Tax=Peterkaempfera bronchialis TaxID=2126346 RepID=A0A345T0H9_9ACTN|nr:hypothetical protein [Peterkaempfera bronchialis]AXI79484.1 hypothetical protein C7M71_020790 [Peterkaempfera bronchialis]
MNRLDPLLGLLVSMAVVGFLVLLLRWTFSGGKSLVSRAPRSGAPGEYGLLVSVAAPRDAEEALRLTRLLDEAGIRNTVVHTTQGARVMVWPDDAARARGMLAGPNG